MLTPETVLQAYCAGIFPMALDRHSTEIRWFDPEARGVLPIDDLHVSKKLRRVIRQQPYRITFDLAFEDVMRGCADSRPDTWINDEIIRLYTELHKQGHAHSVEAWDGGKLVGGLYGIAMGGAFFGESMFSTADDASKVALVYLVARLWRQGFELLDTQFINDHLKQFGVYEVPRDEYRRRLKMAVAKQASFNKDQSCPSFSPGSSSPAGGASEGFSAGIASLVLGAPSGAFSVENSCGFDDVTAFLHSISQTS
jgi:leucyl/phenylalanyl-tRNA--protein transferase